MLAEFSIVPMGKGESVSVYVAEVIEIIQDSALPYKLNPMGTVVEGSWDEVMALLKKCHEHIINQAPRVITQIKIDDRPGKDNMIESKIRSVLDKTEGTTKT
jgi:uncharacterized protein (TIGR00106 family)